MGVSLKYETDDFSTANTNITDLITQIKDAKQAMIDGLDQIKADWVSEGATAFFDSIDDDWATSVDNCIDVLNDLLSCISTASTKYGEIETEAPNYLKF